MRVCDFDYLAKTTGIILNVFQLDQILLKCIIPAVKSRLWVAGRPEGGLMGDLRCGHNRVRFLILEIGMNNIV